MSLTTIRAIAEASNAPADLLAALKGSDLTKAMAMDRLGFRAYGRLAKIRAYAIEHPATYLMAKTVKISGGSTPTVANMPDGIRALIFPGIAENANVGTNCIAAEVSTLYTNTLDQLYKAGATSEAAEDYARQVASAAMNARLAVLEQEMPDIVDTLSEKTLLMRQLGNIGGQALLRGAGKVKAITHK